MRLKLDQAFIAASPRLTSPPVPLRSVAIHGGVFALWAVLLAQAFVRDDLFAWSTGILYVLYDTAMLLFVTIATLPLLRRGSKADAEDRPRLTLGVIVAAHNESAGLAATLAALLNQADPPDLIVVADDGSTDETAALLARRFGLVAPIEGEMSRPSAFHPALRWLRLPHGGKARALNAALARIDTDIVLTVDGDTLLDREAVGAMRVAFVVEPKLVAATGILRPVCHHGDSRFLEWFQANEYVRNFLARYAWMRVDGLELISGAFAGYRRDALIEVGGFDTECLVEDYELTHRLLRHGGLNALGWRTRVIGAARATTDAPASVASFLRQRRRWFGGFLETHFWYRDMIADRRFGAIGTFLLPIKAIDTMQPIYGLTAGALLVYFLAAGRFHIVVPVAAVIACKIAIDLAFHLWSSRLYGDWSGERSRIFVGHALAAALLEPFSFQPLRHLGAAWGWSAFVRRRWRASLGAVAPHRRHVARPRYGQK